MDFFFVRRTAVFLGPVRETRVEKASTRRGRVWKRKGRTVTSTGMMRSVDRALSVGAALMGSITPDGARKLENHCVSGEGCGRSERLSSRRRRTRRRAGSRVERRVGTREARRTHVVRLAEGFAEEGVGGEGEGHGGAWGVGFESVACRRVCAGSCGSSRRDARREQSWYLVTCRGSRVVLGRVRCAEIRTPRPRSSPEERARSFLKRVSGDRRHTNPRPVEAFFPPPRASGATPRRAPLEAAGPRPPRRCLRGDRDL